MRGSGLQESAAEGNSFMTMTKTGPIRTEKRCRDPSHRDRRPILELAPQGAEALGRTNAPDRDRIENRNKCRDLRH